MRRGHNIQAWGRGWRLPGGSGRAAIAGLGAVAVAALAVEAEVSQSGRSTGSPCPMEAAAAGGGGSGLLLSEGEQQCYSELFARCAGAAVGGPPDAARAALGGATAATGPVADLFRASQLPAETLHQVGPRVPRPGGRVAVGSLGPRRWTGVAGRPPGIRRPWLGRSEGASLLETAATPLSPESWGTPASSALLRGCASLASFPGMGPLLFPSRTTFWGLHHPTDPKFAQFCKCCWFGPVSAVTFAARSGPCSRVDTPGASLRSELKLGVIVSGRGLRALLSAWAAKPQMFTLSLEANVPTNSSELNCKGKGTSCRTGIQAGGLSVSPHAKLLVGLGIRHETSRSTMEGWGRVGGTPLIPQLMMM